MLRNTRLFIGDGDLQSPKKELNNFDILRVPKTYPKGTYNFERWELFLQIQARNYNINKLLIKVVHVMRKY